MESRVLLESLVSGTAAHSATWPWWWCHPEARSGVLRQVTEPGHRPKSQSPLAGRDESQAKNSASLRVTFLICKTAQVLEGVTEFEHVAQ